MNQFGLVFTVFFMLLGPVKLIAPVARLTQGRDAKFGRDLAVWSTVLAAVLCAFVAVAGGMLMARYRISVDAVRIGGGIVLLLAALQVIFGKAPALRSATGEMSAIQVAASPLATPIIVPPAGIAAILIVMMMAPEYPGMEKAVALGLAIIMVLNFLMMYFVKVVIKTPGLAIVLTVLGAVLIFAQLCLAVQMVLTALAHLGVLNA